MSNAKGADEAEEIRRLKKELARVTGERNILKKRPRISPRMQSEVRVHCLASLAVFVRTTCRLLQVHPRGFYTWLKNPLMLICTESHDPRDRCCPRRLPLAYLIPPSGMSPISGLSFQSVAI